MIFGNLGTALDNEQTIYEAINNNTKYDFKKRNPLNKLLVTLSHYGMNYTDDVINNMKALPANKGMQKEDDLLINQSLYSSVYSLTYNKIPEEEKSFAQKTLRARIDILRRLASQSELEDILDIMTNESIVPDDEEQYYCQPFMNDALLQDLTLDVSQQIKESLNTNFYKIYTLLDFKKVGWDLYKKWLIDGVIAFEIVYDNLEHPHNIIGIIELDPTTLTKEIVKGTTYWVQFKGNVGQERRLLDSQIIYIKYEDTTVTDRQSYLERLIRPFNLYRIIEQAQVIWTVTQSSFKTMFTIPIGGMSRAKGAQTLRQAMNAYREDIKFNTETGQLLVNNSVNLPFNQEYWMPSNETGSPEIQTISDNGPSLNDSDQIQYFENKLYKMSKIPQSRFSKDVQSLWFGSDPTQAQRDEINFTRFVNKLRNTFGYLITKPLAIQLSLSLPNIKNDKRIISGVSLKWNSYNQFAELAERQVDEKRLEYVQAMQQIVIQDSEGNQIPYFSTKFLVERYMGMSQKDLDMNEKYKLEEQLQAKKLKAAVDNNNGLGDQNSLNGDMLGQDNSVEQEQAPIDINNEEPQQPEATQPEETNNETNGNEIDNGMGGNIDNEMNGPVQPESTETTEI